MITSKKLKLFWKSASDPQRVAFITLVGTLGAALITGGFGLVLKALDGPPLQTPHPQIQEYVALLRDRAEQVVAEMDQERDLLLDQLAAPDAQASYSSEVSPQDIKEQLDKLNRTRELFLELHEQHIQAVEAGQMIRAHEIVGRIHHLLEIRKEIAIWLADPSAAYALGADPFPFPNHYPGPAPNGEAASASQRLVWPQGFESDQALVDPLDPARDALWDALE